MSTLEQAHPCGLPDLVVDTSRRMFGGHADQTLAFGPPLGRRGPTTEAFGLLSKPHIAIVRELDQSSGQTAPATSTAMYVEGW